MIQFFQSNINIVITTLTLISHMVFVVGVALFFIQPQFQKWIYAFVNIHAKLVLLVIILGALVGSFIQSIVVGFPPCELCWTQRLMLIPQFFVLIWAILKKQGNDMVLFLLPFSVIGAVVALYQSFVQWGIGGSLLGCTSVGGDCARIYVMEYGYITIPLMSFTIFAYLIATTLIYKKSKNVGQN